MLKDNIEIVTYGNRVINYSVIYSSRKALGITVTPKKQVIIRCPYNASREKVKELIQKRLNWISNKLNYFESLPTKIPARKYESGETHYYLGKQYRLKIIKSRLEEVKLKGKYLCVYTLRGKEKHIVEVMIDYWYKNKAAKKFEDIISNWLQKFNDFNIQKPKVVIKKMIKRWGSCNASNRVTLNQELIKVPLSCINYVIVHELCHLKYRDHDKKYFRLLSSFIPNWQIIKDTLDKFYSNI